MFANDGSGKPVDGAIPGNMIGRREAAREALIEMVAEADDALMEKFFDAGTLTPGRAGRGAQARRRRGAHLPAGADLGHREHRHAAAARRDCRLRAVAGRASAAARRTATARRSRSTTQDGGRRGGVRLEDGRGSVRRTDHAVPRHLRDAQGRLDAAQHQPRRARAPRPPGPAAGQDADQRAGDQGGRHRRRRQAEGDADQRRARRQGRGGEGPARSSSPSRSSPTRSSRRAAATRRRSAPRCTGCRKRIRPSTTRATRRPRSCCSPARDSRTSRSRSPS